jgi:hypothetical protein
MYKKMYMYRMCLFISNVKKIEIMLHKSSMFKMKPGKKLNAKKEESFSKYFSIQVLFKFELLSSSTISLE